MTILERARKAVSLFRPTAYNAGIGHEDLTAMLRVVDAAIDLPDIEAMERLNPRIYASEFSALADAIRVVTTPEDKP